MSKDEATRRKEYLTERELHTNLLQDAYKSFDYALLFLSFSAMALSIDYTTKNHIENSCLFKMVLVLWGLSLALQLLSRFIWTKVLYRQIELINEAYKNETDDVDENKNQYRGWSSTCNLIALFLSILGMFLFLFFVI